MNETKNRENRGARALAALRAGDVATARRLLESELAEKPAQPPLEMALAAACARLSEFPAALAAVEGLLDREPRHFGALILKADILDAMGERRRAASFYQGALEIAPPEAQRTPDIAQAVARAQSRLAQSAGDYEAYLKQALGEKGFLTGSRASHYEQALDILFGKRQLYFQQPRQFYFPGLPQIQFYEREDFDWVGALEAQTDPIRREAEAMLEDEAAFQPYIHARKDEPRLRETQLYENTDWSACYLVRDGAPVPGIAERCPQTMKALESVPLCDIPGKMPAVLFSLLRPKTQIEPHHGMYNTRLICHLPLIVPEGCRLRVGNETRDWREGEMLIFDDSIEHAAYNDSDRLRVVLLFDIWRPELSESDREFLRAIFAAIEAFPAGAG